MFNLGVVSEDATIYIPLPSRAANGAGTAFSAALEEADFDIHKDGSTTALTLTASTITISESVGSVAGKNMLSINLANDTDFTRGSQYQVWLTPDTETLDTRVVAECIAVFTIETTAQQAQRLFADKLYLEATVATTTGNTTSRVLLTDFLDAQTVDGDMIGSVWDYFRSATNQWQRFVCQSVQSARLFNVVVKADGTALDNAVAAGDFLFFVGWDSLMSTVPGRTVGVAAGIADANVEQINAVTVLGAGTSGDKWRA